MVAYDEQQVLGFIADGTALYAAVGRQPDQSALVWPARVVFDACVAPDGGTPMGWTAARAKHLEELRVALGLPPVQIPPPPFSSLHVAPGPRTADQVRKVVFATAQEFPALTKVFDTDGAASAASTELLLRIIWHLSLAGFSEVGRQKNPSGAISGDKFCVKLDDGQWHAYDVMTLGFAGHATAMNFQEVGSPNPIAENGVPDGH